MNIDETVGKVINRSKKIAKLLRQHYGAPKRGLYTVLKDLEGELPSMLNRSIKEVAKVRNCAAHDEDFSAASVPKDFYRLCHEIEQQIKENVPRSLPPQKAQQKPKPPAVPQSQSCPVPAQ